MSLDLSKLENVKRKADGSYEARCPVCAQAGKDTTKGGDNLRIYPDGAYKCIVGCCDKAIFVAAGERKHSVSLWNRVTSQQNSVRASSSIDLLSRIKADFPACVADLWEDSLVRCDEDLDDARAFLRLFPSNAVLWIADDVRKSGRPEHTLCFRTRAEWEAERITAPGARISPAAFRRGTISRKAENVIRHLFAIVESDTLAKDDFGSVLRWLREACGWHLAAVVDSGNKSLHAWFRHPGATDMAILAQYAAGLGLDGKFSEPSQPWRLPGVKLQEFDGTAKPSLPRCGGGAMSVSDGLKAIGADEQRSGPVARSLSELAADTAIVKPPPLIHGLLHRADLMLMGAASKSFKSWSFLDLALSIANGAEWWGLLCAKGSVLYVDFELREVWWRERALAIAAARGLSTDGVFHLACRGREPIEVLRAVEREASARTFDLIIFDPLYSFLAGRDENAAGDVGMVMRQLSSIAEGSGAALALSHHFAKGNASGKESQDRFSGSGVFARFPDALLTMTRHEEDGAFVIDSTIRNFATMPSWVMRWQHPLMVRDGALDPAKLKKAPGAFEAKYSVSQLVDVLGSQPMTFGQIEHAAKEHCGMSKPTVNRLLKQGIEAGSIEKSNLLYRGITVSRP